MRVNQLVAMKTLLCVLIIGFGLVNGQTNETDTFTTVPDELNSTIPSTENTTPQPQQPGPQQPQPQQPGPQQPQPQPQQPGPQPQPQPQQPGLQPQQPQPQQPGPQNSIWRQFAHQVIIVNNYPNNQKRCGGSLIQPNIVLTTANCVGR